MKKSVLVKIIAMLAIMVMCVGSVSAFATGSNQIIGDDNNGVITPYNIAIISTYNYLSINSSGKATCEGETQVQDGYIAGVTMELQQYINGNWNTIKTWSGTDWDCIYLGYDWYILNGYSYRLKLTHTSLNSNWNVIETIVKYSRTVSY